MIQEKQTVLVVDDNPDNITLISGLLRQLYQIKVAINGAKAITMIKKNPPDIILLDVVMPEMDGYEVCRALKNDIDFWDIPIIFLTAQNDIQAESKGFKLGAADYITKPVSPPILLSRVKTHLDLKKASDFLKSQNHFLEKEISRRTREVALIQEVSIMAMAALAETRDSETGLHLQRTKLYVSELCEELARRDGYEKSLTREIIDTIVASAPLHDIGKVGIPDAVLLKPGKLTTAEFEIMKNHAILGREAIIKAELIMDRRETYLKYPKEIVSSHHEKWDGSGYPQGLSGEQIPLSARIVALADAYDAITSERVYKNAVSHEEAMAIIKADSGRHFDPMVVSAFLQVHEKFKIIAQKYREPGVGVYLGD
jgi:putative two-component system response regulator